MRGEGALGRAGGGEREKGGGVGWLNGPGKGGKLIPFFSFFSYSISIISV
jgi:hypothetical protein